MARLAWNELGYRFYESGLDRGVLYLQDGTAVAWNGLTSVTESYNKESSPIYYDGQKINDLVVLGDFAGTMKAITYPDEFIEVEGLAESSRAGIFFADQPPKTFNLCYRTLIGNDLEGTDYGYKLHLLYNVIAMPSEKEYTTLSMDSSAMEFEWSITAVPEEIEGFRPTAHVIFDSTKMDEWLLRDLEDILYGKSDADATLPTIAELLAFVDAWYRVEITDNGDGTWTADVRPDSGLIWLDPPDNTEFEILTATATYLDADTYELTDTTDLPVIP